LKLEILFNFKFEFKIFRYTLSLIIISYLICINVIIILSSDFIKFLLMSIYYTDEFQLVIIYFLIFSSLILISLTQLTLTTCPSVIIKSFSH